MTFLERPKLECCVSRRVAREIQIFVAGCRSTSRELHMAVETWLWRGLDRRTDNETWLWRGLDRRTDNVIWQWRGLDIRADNEIWQWRGLDRRTDN